GANQYPGVTTGVGAGTAELLADLRFLHPDFFPNHEQIGVYLTTDLKTPFRNVDPSQQFSDTPGGVNPSGVTPSIGAINGVSGPDFQFEGDARGILLPE